MANVKGIVILNAHSFVVARFGEAGWSRVLARLPRDDGEALASLIPVGWYDILLLDRVNRAVEETLGTGDMALAQAIGAYSAEHDLTTIHRIFLRVANPAYVLEKSAEFWRRYQDSGTWTVVRETPTSVRATLRDWGSRDEVTCIRLAAYIHRLFQLVGAKNTSMARLRCRARGDDACHFLGNWE